MVLQDHNISSKVQSIKLRPKMIHLSQNINHIFLGWLKIFIKIMVRLFYGLFEEGIIAYKDSIYNNKKGTFEMQETKSR